MLYKLFRPVIFLLPSRINRTVTFFLFLLEVKIHAIFATASKCQVNIDKCETDKATIGKVKPRFPTLLMGLNFDNPIGMAAGFDPDGRHIDLAASIGFGFVELGTITPKAFSEDGFATDIIYSQKTESIIKSGYGYNNPGVESLYRSLLMQKARKNKNILNKPVIGVNIARNNSTAVANAILDYKYCLHRLYSEADYFVINISEVSPTLLLQIKQAQQQLADKHAKYTPLLVKIDPTLKVAELYITLDLLVSSGIDGVVITYTTAPGHTNYAAVVEHVQFVGGRQIKQEADQLLENTSQYLQGKLIIISNGGIFSAVDVKRRLELGANLVQLYSALFFRGPGVVRKILHDMPVVFQN